MSRAAAHGGGLDALLASLARTTLVVGKGGVGKTTCAVGVAAILAKRGHRTLLLSTDPAAALATVAETPIGHDAAPIAAVPGLSARQLSAPDLRAAFLNRWRATIQEIIDRGTYLDRTDIEGLIDSTLPGADEVFAFLEIASLVGEPGEYDRIVVDTAPTGHTLRLLHLADTFQALVALLDAMQEKHRFMVRALTRRRPRDRADEFLERMQHEVDAFRSAFADPHRVAALLVTRAEPTVFTETRSYADALRTLGISIAAIVVNAVSSDLAAGVLGQGDGVPEFQIAAVRPPPVGVKRVAALIESVHAPSGRPASHQPRKAFVPPGQRINAATLARSVTIVGGKGGVGKSTVACALAIASADAGRGEVLLVSTDPAPSVADVFGDSNAPWARSGDEHRPPDVPRLVLRQLDASTAFNTFRDRYQGRIDALFESIVPHGVDLSADRRIMRDLLALAPPGIDELYALSVLGDEVAVVDDPRFSRVIVDPAPTGHLLRLLEMPSVALEWTHRLMRLLLKYQTSVGLGDTAADLLAFARQTRTIDGLLRDPARSGVLVVALNEPVVRAEAERLANAIGTLGIDVIGILWNQVDEAVEPLPTTPGAAQFVADRTAPGPVGPEALREWSQRWHRLTTDLS